MAAGARKQPEKRDGRPPHLNVLVLQGGGALGAYHLGVSEELAGLGIAPDWVCGISIGAINAALIAGNRPGERIGVLTEFWERISSGLVPGFEIPHGPFSEMWSEGAAMWIAATGVPGFFRPRFPPAKLQPKGSVGALSFYDTEPLRQTLDELVDWDWLNDGPMRLSVGAVSVTTGRMHFFDSKGGPDHCRISADHILASGALPPGFPPVQIGEDWFWDGGIASNAPLQHVLDEGTEFDKNIFQVDLFPAEGPFPETLLDAETRAQDIRYSSRTRLNTNMEMSLSPARLVVRRVLESCHPDLSGLSEEDLRTLRAFACEQHIEIAQIIYRDKAYGGKARGYEFSRPTMEAHRAAGRRDAAKALAVRDWRLRPEVNGVHCIDVGAEEPVLKAKVSR
ncbi:patatin-like phospholipase family protein [Sandaracinobacteroides hominis]|uniref:patatin-like phospholipase family protein n=1 Tax=Sandaracinobacteroides hominis TaxID=2780086 RepID=UPI0018F4F0FD|nr:patatin-like phospholipase family protein [Sandaracinobacteroides hominis]